MQGSVESYKYLGTVFDFALKFNKITKSRTKNQPVKRDGLF